MRLAVYGILRMNAGRLSCFMEDANFLGKTKTEPEFTMYGGGCPVVCPGGITAITVEVYDVDEDTMKGTDRLEGYPHHYDRMEIDTKYGKAWMYFQQPYSLLSNNRIIKTGDWHDQLEENYIG